ncbi:MAG: SGNH/GDSL hydrolase family protein [Clostridia bacterium]|nr:SGNH/GDSL hydrolase family protein [Clostridia bacterium]MBQ8720295.1 SGNH/GDSL hydrolase family protein [Clostridia bacterium]
MDWNKLLYSENEKPLDTLVGAYSHTSVFRKIAFVGDSLSSGEFQIKNENGGYNYHDLYEYSWGQYIARKCGLTAYNFSRGGMTAKEYIESFAENNGMWDKEKACQAYVIALGVNDVYNKGMEIGSVADIDTENWKNNKPTFLGYYAMIISRYKEISPDAKFFFVTFPKEESRDGQKDLTLGVNSALYDLAKIFENSYVIDLYKYGPVYDKSFKDKYFLYGHMTPSGYILTAQLVDSYIDYIVRHNPEDFKYAGYINSGIKYKF